ncbi:MAG: methylmalonyl Co-A mutase-associated GTPase MeaB [Bacteroidales bacterium]
MSDEMVRYVTAAAGRDASAVRAAARLMTLLSDEPARLPELFQAYAAAGFAPGEEFPSPRLLVGITGAPGCGKSTLTDALVREFRRRQPARRVGVIAVDPSSPFTGGAVLGDRVRMMRHATDPMVFVRSLATRGHLGGLTLGVKGIIRVMALIGCDVVFVETVGVGQSEVEIASVADLVMIVLAPGQGDSIQLLKAGLMEIGDMLVVNKADRPEAARLHSQVLSMLKMDDRPGRAKAYLVSAEEQRGLDELVNDLETLGSEHHEEWQARRRRAVTEEIRDAILHEAQRRLADSFANGHGAAAIERVLSGETTVDGAAAALLRSVAGEKAEG